MLAQALSASILGVDGALVRVEVDVAFGLPSLTIVGLAGSQVQEARERVRSALRNTGFEAPARRITVNLAPASLALRCMMRGMTDRELKRAENELRPLLTRLDSALDKQMTSEQRIAIGMGLRGRELHRAVIHACSGPSLMSAQIVLRALVDLSITARWIEESPERRIRMWFAEDDRNRITGAEGWEAMHARRKSTVPPAFSAQEISEMRGRMDAVREEARAAGEAIGERGALIPPLATMAEGIADLAEVYGVAYRSLSPSAHSSARSFVSDAIESREDGLHIRPQSQFTADQIRWLALPTACFVVETISRQAGLGIESDANSLRLRVATWPSQQAGQAE